MKSQRTSKRLKSPRAVASIDTSTPLITLAKELSDVKSALEQAKRNEAIAEDKLSEATLDVTTLTIRHKELQAALASEALLVKPE